MWLTWVFETAAYGTARVNAVYRPTLPAPCAMARLPIRRAMLVEAMLPSSRLEAALARPTTAGPGQRARAVAVMVRDTARLVGPRPPADAIVLCARKGMGWTVLRPHHSCLYTSLRHC